MLKPNVNADCLCLFCKSLIIIGPRQANWYLSPMRATKVQASLRIRAVSPEPSLLAHTSSESRGTFRQKARSLAPLNGWACAVEICHDGMLEDTNSLDGAHIYQNTEFFSVLVFERIRLVDTYGNFHDFFQISSLKMFRVYSSCLHLP